MRPIKTATYAPITALATAFNDGTFNSTGASTTVATSATTDGLAHTVTLVAPVQATLAGLTFTIVGTDADGRPQTETGLVGPASGATVTSTKYFKTVSTVQPSATMGALVLSVGCSAVSSSPSIALERRSISPAYMDMGITGTINYTLNETFEDIFAAAPSTLRWFAIAAFTAKATDIQSAATVASSGVRVITNTVTNGATYTLYISQATQITG